MTSLKQSNSAKYKREVQTATGSLHPNLCINIIVVVKISSSEHPTANRFHVSNLWGRSLAFLFVRRFSEC